LLFIISNLHIPGSVAVHEDRFIPVRFSKYFAKFALGKVINKARSDPFALKGTPPYKRGDDKLKGYG